MFQLKKSRWTDSSPDNPEKNMNGAEDYMLLLVHVFVCAHLQLEQPC